MKEFLKQIVLTGLRALISLGEDGDLDAFDLVDIDIEYAKLAKFGPRKNG